MRSSPSEKPIPGVAGPPSAGDGQPAASEDDLARVRHLKAAYEQMTAQLGRVIVGQAVESIGRERVSFTLEIHPTSGRSPLGAAERLFAHWTDKTNAEQMNHWLEDLVRNHALVRSALA